MSEEQVDADFKHARFKAFLRDLLAVLRRQQNDLIPYHEVRRRLSPEGESYRGVQTVPLDRIVGSMDRFRDFDRAFLPRQEHTAGRWKSVDRAYYQDKTLPPIQLYQVGDVYFVKDGNHRVSVARERGQEFIDAEVIEGRTRVPLYASMAPQDLLLQAEYAEFLRRTDLDRLRPEHDIRPTALGRYDEIWQHIRLHQQELAAHRGRPVAIEEAIADWYDNVYCPIARVVRERAVLEWFPDRTEADVYLWVMRHRDDLERRYGHEVEPEAAAADYAAVVARRAGPLARLRVGIRSLVKRLKHPARGLRPAPTEPTRP